MRAASSPHLLPAAAASHSSCHFCRRDAPCRRMLREFREFLARGSVLDLAVGIIIGAAFGKIVTTLVEGIVMPPIGMMLNRVDFASLFYVLDASQGVPASL